MDIRKRIRDALMFRAKTRHIDEVRIGLGYTAVTLDNGQAGVAFTFLRQMIHHCSLFPESIPLRDRPSMELLELLCSGRDLEISVGMATANALANTLEKEVYKGDILDFLDIRQEDRVGMVGMFAPLVKQLKERATELVVFEKNRSRAIGLMPETEIVNRLPDCQVALITATSIVNHSMDDFLHAAARCREVAVLGATTPLLPEAFADTPVTCLSGVVVKEPDEVMRVVSTAGGMQQFKSYVEKVNLPLK
jgi:hypothetical protein